jgi:sugar/nucleoside kinase (ribokinase family)
MVRFTAVGHVTNDLLAGGAAAGGSALYAAITARELGATVRVVTSHGPDFVGGALLDGVAVEVVPSPRTTTFENVYDGAGRHQRVTAIATPLAPPAFGDADAVFVCPVIDEVDPVPGAAVGLQGWMRAIDGGIVRPRSLDVARFAGCRAAFVSTHDLGDDADRVLPELRAQVPIVVVTHGASGAEVHAGGETRHIAAFPTDEVDPTGAGDVFAAAFLLALARGESPFDAGIYAACAASVVVEGVGPSALSRLSFELPGRLRRFASCSEK